MIIMTNRNGRLFYSLHKSHATSSLQEYIIYKVLKLFYSDKNVQIKNQQLWLSVFKKFVCMSKQNLNQQLQRLVSFGKIAEQTERYDDQIKYMTEVLTSTTLPTFEDLTLYANGYKCKINSIRTAWRAISALQCKQTNSKSRSAAIIQFYKQKLQKQIRQVCQHVICLVNNINNPQLQQKVKFLSCKIKGDYHRYLCQIAKDEELKKFQKQCQNAYLKGIKMINQSSVKEQTKLDSLKLGNILELKIGISLNLSVFYYQILNMTQKAIEVSQSAFNQCLEAVSDIQDNRFTDLVTIMQLVHDNLTNWKNEAKI